MIAVVVAGLLLGHKAPIVQTAQSRIAERMNWSSIAFLLESAVFLLIGLQARWIISDVVDGELSFGRIALVCGGVLVGVIVLRLVWTLPRPVPADARAGHALQLHVHRGLGRHAWGGDAGRGVRDPGRGPHLDVLLLAAFTVTAGTLFLQGLTLPWLARRLRIPGPGPGGRRAGPGQPADPGFSGRARRRWTTWSRATGHDVSPQIRNRLEHRDFAAWEQLGQGQAETPAETYARGGARR